jgi:ElaB/YqjD/DUF883 family membrane-anchored ribosome-binding protein
MTHPLPAEVLEQRASDQRRRLHNSVAELRYSVRERLDYRKLARENVWQAAGAVAFVGLILGWGFAGMFTRR